MVGVNRSNPYRLWNGEGGIRTPGEFDPTTDFESAAVNRSATSPGSILLRIGNTLKGRSEGINPAQDERTSRLNLKSSAKYKNENSWSLRRC